MCGITGLFEFGSSHPIALAQAVRRMRDAMPHRGPDDSGEWLDPDCGLAFGQRRLAVVDLSPQGHQPMQSADGRWVLTYNGEIYNHRELRQELTAAGLAPAWCGHSDTEVMLAAIAAWGIEATLKKLTGMFAIALWDRQQQALTLARDRLGEKPLYYGWQGGKLLFGSELKALRAHPDWQGLIDREALCQYLRFAYVPAPRSIYQNIRKLPAGCWLTFSLTSPRPAWPMPQPYWSLADVIQQGRRQPFTGDDHSAITRLEGLLSHAIGRQMEADVPLGAFLSGGVDSSTVVALMQAQARQPVRTFTIGFDAAGFNEAEHAAAVARHLGTTHTALYLTDRDALDVIPQLPFLYDEPFADASQIPTHLVAKLARQHVTVSLSGDGGDELFGGYNRYLLLEKIWNTSRRLPSPVRQGLAWGLGRLSPASWDRLLQNRHLPRRLRLPQASDKLAKLAGSLKADNPMAIYLGLLSQWQNPSSVVVHSNEPANPYLQQPEWLAALDITDQMMALDTLGYMADDILVKVDRAAMGVSLETRVPMLDHSVVEFAWTLPRNLRIRDGVGKWILRQVLYRHVPRELIERPKAGFAVPLAQWLRGPLREWAEDLLNPATLAAQGYFNPAPILSCWQQHLSGRANWQYPLWGILMFQQWLQQQTDVQRTSDNP